MAGAIARLSRFAGRKMSKRVARRYASALFIPGNKATENFSFLTPYLDFDERFADVDKLRRELELRRSDVDVCSLVEKWNFYKSVDADKWALESKRKDVARRMKEIMKKTDATETDEREKNKLTMQANVLKRELREIKETLWEMEETVVVQALKFPNEIDDATPKDEAVVLRSVGKIREPPLNERKNHLDIGRDLDLVFYKNPINFYLRDDAALFEIAVANYASDVLASANMFRVAGTDFVRSLVIEACGLDHENPRETFVLTNNEGIDRNSCNRLHLVGGASVASFLAMHAKQLVNPNDFPLKYYATGRQYVPVDECASSAGLFDVCQSTAVQIFVAVKDFDGDNCGKEFGEISNVVSKVYDDIGIHYRVVARSAGELRNWESLRISYEMWSSYLRRYVEVGHLSMCGQYFSKRLLFAFQTPTGRDFPAVITGTILSVPRLLACLLEENPKRFEMPAKIAEYVPRNE